MNSIVEGQGGTTPPPWFLALDLSLTGTGVASNIDASTLTYTIAPKKITGAERMDWLRGEAGKAILRNDPDAEIDDLIWQTPELIVVEGLAYGSKTGSAMERAGWWWQVRMIAHDYGITFAEVPPNNLKKYATGKGNAGKDEVMIAVTRQWPEWGAKNNNEADAVVLMNMALDHYGLVEPVVPKINREGLLKVSWPELEL